MSLTHADILKLLQPIELGGENGAENRIDGGYLDDAETAAESLINEMYPDTAYKTLSSWERVYDLVPSDGATIQSRRDAIVQKIRARGGLSRAYFIALAAVHGWTITIDEFYPSMCGWTRCGDNLCDAGSLWVWRVNVAGKSIYNARAGSSAAGERLLWWVSNSDLENLITRLKPAHTVVLFSYA